MKASKTLEFIAEASDVILELREALLRVKQAESLDEAHRLAADALKRTTEEDDE